MFSAGPCRFEGFEPAAGFDGVELMVVANDDRLGTSDIDSGEVLEHRLVVGHACFIDQEHRLLVEREGPMLQAPDERGDGTAVGARAA